MAIVHIEGKQIALPDDVVNAGEDAIRAILGANGFPALENAHIVISKRKGHPTLVRISPRTGGTNEKYKEAINALRQELDGAIIQHSQLEKRIAKLRATIASFEQLNESEALSKEAQATLGTSLSAPAAIGLTESIRQILKTADHPLLVREVKQALIDRGYDVKRYQNISGAIPIVLKRLRNQGEVDIELQKVGDKKYFGYVYIPSEEQPVKLKYVEQRRRKVKNG